MQIDMHYYGTYALARAAGLAAAPARVIATAAQYVDDNVGGAGLAAGGADALSLRDGASISLAPTAHHIDLGAAGALLNPVDQRQVWVPFHFLPGNQGDEFTERLICRRGSATADAMVSAMIDRAAKDSCVLERAGITAHVLADTFSHWGFSGVGSRRNRVRDGSITLANAPAAAPGTGLQAAAQAFFDRLGGAALVANIKVEVADLGGLGHGAVATYPDIPYLRWSFAYDSQGGGIQQRDNPACFRDACAALYALFSRLAATVPALVDSASSKPFDAILPVITAILAAPLEIPGRIDLWCQAARRGDLFGHVGAGGDIPPYAGDDWTARLSEAHGRFDSEQAFAEPALRFFMAAASHRAWVLHDGLPTLGLSVA